MSFANLLAPLEMEGNSAFTMNEDGMIIFSDDCSEDGRYVCIFFNEKKKEK